MAKVTAAEMAEQNSHHAALAFYLGVQRQSLSPQEPAGHRAEETYPAQERTFRLIGLNNGSMFYRTPPDGEEIQHREGSVQDGYRESPPDGRMADIVILHFCRERTRWKQKEEAFFDTGRHLAVPIHRQASVGQPISPKEIFVVRSCAGCGVAAPRTPGKHCAHETEAHQTDINLRRSGIAE